MGWGCQFKTDPSTLHVSLAPAVAGVPLGVLCHCVRRGGVREVRPLLFLVKERILSSFTSSSPPSFTLYLLLPFLPPSIFPRNKVNVHGESPGWWFMLQWHIDINPICHCIQEKHKGRRQKHVHYVKGGPKSKTTRRNRTKACKLCQKRTKSPQTTQKNRRERCKFCPCRAAVATAGQVFPLLGKDKPAH